MKALSLALFLSFSLTLTAVEVQPGNTLDEVRASLGLPKGQLRVGERHLLYYDRGEIELRAGTVTRVALLSVEEHAALEARRAVEAVRMSEERARLSADGEILRDRKLADPFFQAAPLAYQVAFWENFARRYPGVTVTEQLAIARLRLADQLEQRRAQTEQAERLAELEARAREAEARSVESEVYAQSTGSYASAYYRGRSYPRHSFTLWPVQYPANVNAWQYSVTPLPGSSAPVIDHHRRDGQWPANRLDSGRHDSRGHEHFSDGAPQSFVGRNRL